MKRASLLPLLLFAGLAAPRLAPAQDLPKAETILDKYVEVTGGKAAYAKVKNRVLKGTMSVTGVGIEGKITISQAAPNKQSVVTDLGQIGKSISGTDGKIAWETNPFTGDRLLEGDELAENLFRSEINSEPLWRDRYIKVECTAVENVEGKPAYKVAITPKTGKPMIEWYDKESGLLVRQQSTTISPMGEITVDVYPSDYKKVDGVSVAYLVKQKMLSQEVVIKVDEVVQNGDLPADTFKPPAEIEALLKKKAQ